MSTTILLYGATGYSGRLIAAEGERAASYASDGKTDYSMVLAGRDGTALAQLGRDHGMEYRVFRLEDRTAVTRGLRDIDVVINAAGPFALTAKHLARGALVAGCHYVDINGEVDVYKKLDDLGRHAAQRHLAMVCSAGHTAAASDLLLYTALNQLRSVSKMSAGDIGEAAIELGAVRIALSRIMSLSRGSTDTLLRSLREQVTVVRMGEVDDGYGGVKRAPVLWHEPIGKLERTFKFCDGGDGNGEGTRKKRPVRIASAANLVDTLTARLTVARRNFSAHRIESYVEVGTVGRIGYQLGALLAPLAAIPAVRDLARVQIDALPDGPAPQDRKVETLTLVLEIEDLFQGTIIDWRWHTLNPYDFTAQVVVEVAKRVAASQLTGWLTSSEVLLPKKEDLTSADGYLRGCRLDDGTRVVAARRSAR
jgi:hypothetical protein